MNLSGAEAVSIREQVKQIGWASVGGIEREKDLLDLARYLGKPIPHPSGELIKTLVPTGVHGALPNSLSSRYGCGSFPLHTDTAFWACPARFIILQIEGDARRPTTFASFMALFEVAGCGIRNSIERSIWFVPGSQSMYCSMRFRLNGEVGWRYDNNCMKPANKSALEVEKAICPLLRSWSEGAVEWVTHRTIVLDNWKLLHGRGDSPPEEALRLLKRVYVR